MVDDRRYRYEIPGVSPNGLYCIDCGEWTNQPYEDRCWNCHKGNEKLDRRRRRQISPSKREKVRDLYKGRCAHCGTDEDLEIDHIKRVADGGANGLDNLQLLCRSCNEQKG